MEAQTGDACTIRIQLDTCRKIHVIQSVICILHLAFIDLTIKSACPDARTRARGQSLWPSAARGVRPWVRRARGVRAVLGSAGAGVCVHARGPPERPLALAGTEIMKSSEYALVPRLVSGV